MADPDLNAFLAETAPAQAAEPALRAFLAQTAPAQATPPPQPGGGEALARGAGQGFTLGFGDEINGGVQALGDKLMGSDKSLGDLYRRNRDVFRSENDQAKAAHPYLYGAGEVAGSIPTTFLPGLNVGKGAKALQVLLRTGAAGGLTGLGNSNADLTQGQYGQAAKDTAVGTGLGVAAGGAGLLLGKLGGRAAAKVADIDETVARKAAADAAAQTASARGEAGRAAQDTYKQLEHLRELDGKGLLSEQGQKLASSLEAELAQKSANNLEASAARKASTSDAYSDALSSEGQRASNIAESKLGPGELRSQVGTRLIRYGLPAVGAALGHAAFGGHGMAEGLALGAVARPAARSLLRMAKQPVVQRPVMSALSAAFGGAATATERLASEGASTLTPSAERMIALIQALRKQAPQPQFAEGDTQ